MFKKGLGGYVLLYLVICKTIFGTGNAFGDGLSHQAQECAQQMDQFMGPGPLEGFDFFSRTVFYDGSSDDNTVTHSKWWGSAWYTDKVLNKKGFTNQGDIRNPIFVMGTQLAALFGFKIEYVKKSWGINDRIKISAPGAIKLGEKIKKANRHLKAKGLEAIPYYLVRAGFIKEEEDALDIALDTKDDAEMNFVYADLDPTIAAHEIAFHIIPILFPKKFFSRARQINQHTKRFSQFLRARIQEFPKAELLAKQLIKERVLELDFGTGNTAGLLATRRSGGNPLSFRNLWGSLRPRRADLKQAAVQIDYLSRPSITPLEALLRRIEEMVGVEVSPGVAVGKDFPIPVSRRFLNFGFGNKIALDENEITALKKIVSDYIADTQNNDPPVEISSSEKWLEELYLGLDKRIKDLTWALQQPEV